MPDIVRLLSTALHPAAQAQIIAIDLLGFVHVPLIEQERGERVARRVHPGSWLGVGEIVIELHRPAQMSISLVMIALMISKLAIGQSCSDRKRIARGIAQKTALDWDVLVKVGGGLWTRLAGPGGTTEGRRTPSPPGPIFLKTECSARSGVGSS
jgi:hypothetical protein